ncbi:hypothetical protein NA644_07325 [Pseudomonas stutzeri]|uniref:hypothetical protein n=1 Tax=Stutzerimonas stutzeri TaxID=316 RepID=UPI00210D151E|nr:hypothetical protein [Stutzerimonas stutzeri]MCQ4249119.1 hypothetical protein [Stutzerimonas stutzeri]
MIAENWLLSREALEAYALESHQRALRAIAKGRFTRDRWMGRARRNTARRPWRRWLNGMFCSAVTVWPQRCRARPATPAPC